MSFREKVLWACLLLPAVMWIWFFSLVAAAIAGPAPIDESLFAAHMLEVAVASVAVQLAAMALLARREANPVFAPDEREQLFEYRGVSTAYHVVSIGILVVVTGNFLGWSRFAIVNLVVLVYLLSEALKIGVELHLLRRRGAR